MFWITKNHKLDFKGYLQRTPPVTKHFSAIQKINDKAFLEKFRVKKSSILIGLENFGTIESLIMGWLGCTLIKQKMTKYPPKAFQLESEGSQFKLY